MDELRDLIKTVIRSFRTSEIPNSETIFGVKIKYCPFNPWKFTRYVLGSFLFNNIIHKNIAKLYPDYNFANIVLLYENDIYTNNIFEYINRVNSQYMIIYVSISYDYDDESEYLSGAHANMVFIDLINLTAEYFEPHGYRPDTLLDQNELLVGSILRQYVHPEIKLIQVKNSCPNLGPQSLTEDTFCQTWVNLYMYIKINIPELGTDEIYSYLTSMPIHDLKMTLGIFQIYYVWIVTRYEERYIMGVEYILKKCVDVLYDREISSDIELLKPFLNGRGNIPIGTAIDIISKEIRLEIIKYDDSDLLHLSRAYKYAQDIIKILQINDKLIIEYKDEQ